MTYDPDLFAEKYRLALQADIENRPQGGLCGFELEWNLLDDRFRPLLTVGSGPGQQSFVDYLRAECLSPWIREYSQLEVFHWMIEWATQPYFAPRAAVYEGRLLEGALLNALQRAGRQFGERLYYWHGNLLAEAPVGAESIPGSWNLAKRRYLERCVDLYGTTLATAGTHTNLSLPDPLLAWDFMHLSPTERGDWHLDDYKSEFYITATRLLRAFAALFIATSAATPLQAVAGGCAGADSHEPVNVVLTEIDSVRNLTFPNPAALDQPNLYRSYKDYLQLSYDLVRRGVRFGNNNWTPVRARSFAEPVERLILVTSEQLGDLYARGLYAVGEPAAVEEMAHQIEIQNLLARINLPMARVEVRTDDGGHPLEVEIANLTLKHLLLVRFYADPEFGRAFRYDREDLARARANEAAAARDGLRAEIADPLTGKPAGMRDFLRWTLAEVRPLAEALGLWGDLAPLVEMAAGAPNTAERLRARLRGLLKARPGECVSVPAEVLEGLAEEREAQVQRDVERIAAAYARLPGDATRLGRFLQCARDEAHLDTLAPVRFRPPAEGRAEGGAVGGSPGPARGEVSTAFPGVTGEVLSLAQELIRIPSVTAGPEERLDEVRRAATRLYDLARDAGLQVRYFDQDKYPALLVGFPGQLAAPVMLAGHFDVVAPEPDDRQFEPRVEGDYLWGRGAADMKTVVATYLVWLRAMRRQGPPYPPVNLLLVGNEENGEVEPAGTPHVLRRLAEESGYAPGLLVAGERTGERGDELWGEICTQNRGVMRFEVIGRGQRGHTGVGGAADLTGRLLQARAEVAALLGERLTLEGADGWRSQVGFPFVQIGAAGGYNISPDYGVIGVEVRPVPQDDVAALEGELAALCARFELELRVSVREAGIVCDPGNRYLQALVEAVREVSGQEPVLGRKLAGTSARFAPGGQGVVWGQSGVGPHGREERHFIPSIEPYYRALVRFGEGVRGQTHL